MRMLPASQPESTRSKIIGIRFSQAGVAVAAIALLVPQGLLARDITSPEAVLATYADIAAASYEDASTTAETLHASIEALLADPSSGALEQARKDWVLSRVPYQQTEVYRFGNPLVDEWEGKVNAWPLDEGLIDYVDASYGQSSEANDLYTANVIANPSMKVDGQPVDAKEITPELLGDTLHEAGGIESNVATGYHAIEFLLWGQDLNGGGPGAGVRPWSDFASGDACTNGNCERRADYLRAASTLLVADLNDMADAWKAGGAARASIVDAPASEGIGRILTGMGSLSYGELGGERMQLGLMLHDPEEEHDCFSDNTAASHYNDGVGIQNVYEGRYVRVDGSTLQGPSLRELLAMEDPALADELGRDIEASVTALRVMFESQLAGKAYDQLIAEGDTEGNALVQAGIDALVVQTRGIERAIAALDVNAGIEGSDSLDDPDSVFQ